MLIGLKDVEDIIPNTADIMGIVSQSNINI
jgi:hypothetical protein